MMISYFYHLSGLKILMPNYLLNLTFEKVFQSCCLDRILILPIGLQDLKDYMRQAGEVTYADAHKQHRNEG